MITLLNITPSYKIFISPIMATLKAETCSCFTLSVSNTVCFVFEGFLQIIKNLCFLIIISCCRCIIQFNISLPYTLRASRYLFFQLSETNFCGTLSFSYERNNSHTCLQPCSDFLNKYLVHATKKGTSTVFSQQSHEFLRYSFTVSISPLLFTHPTPPPVLRVSWQQGTKRILGFSLSEVAFSWSKCREFLRF